MAELYLIKGYKYSQSGNKRFSREFDSFNDWLAEQCGLNPFIAKIIRKHYLYPDASLKELTFGSGKNGKYDRIDN